MLHANKKIYLKIHFSVPLSQTARTKTMVFSAGTTELHANMFQKLRTADSFCMINVTRSSRRRASSRVVGEPVQELPRETKHFPCFPSRNSGTGDLTLLYFGESASCQASPHQLSRMKIEEVTNYQRKLDV